MDEIKRRTTAWTPMEVNENPAKDKPADFFTNRLGLKRPQEFPIFDMIARQPSVLH